MPALKTNLKGLKRGQAAGRKGNRLKHTATNGRKTLPDGDWTGDSPEQDDSQNIDKQTGRRAHPIKRAHASGHAHRQAGTGTQHRRTHTHTEAHTHTHTHA